MDRFRLIKWAEWAAPDALAALLFVLIVSPSAARAETIEIRLEPNQTVRQLSERYLGDPDLWPEILKASGVASVTQLAPGQPLRIPVDLIAAAERALARCADQIRLANLAGAQLFAPDEIGRAIGLYDRALGRRIERAWADAKDLALESHSEAAKALAISEDRRDEAAEALLTDKNGWVEAQKPKDLAWNDIQLRALLEEQEKVRTLSESTAQLTFRDASRLRLNANSNAIIQQMRYDPLTRHEEAKVSLIEGDFYALLASESERTSFEVEIPEAQARIESGDFWVSSGDAGAKFTNYDDRPVAVATSSETVVLGRNEGLVLSAKGEATEKRGVLDPPRLSAPGNDGIVYATSFDLAWASSEGAGGYWLEIGADQAFDTMLVSEFGLPKPAFRVERLPPGEYYWRVSALDAFGLPGERSAPWRFTVAIDKVAPFLRIDAPGEGAIERDAVVEIWGETEPGAAVTVNGRPVDVTALGRFTGPVAASEGENRVDIVATDPAGNATRLLRRFSHMPDRSEAVVLDAAVARDPGGRILSSGDVASLSGRTKPDSRIDIVGADGILRGSTASDSAGRFALNIGLGADEEALSIVVTAPSGFRTAHGIEVVVDRTRPTITLSEELSRLTASETLFVRGRVAKADATLLINGREVGLKDGAFDEIVSLRVGDNPIELVATDTLDNTEVARFTITLDKDPPRLVSAKIIPEAGDAGSFAAVEVSASDSSGLAATAIATVAYGSETADAVLRFNRATQSYQGSLPVPRGGLRAAAVRTVDLTDAAGNRQSYRIE
ncbi:FecR domain-containing protein [Inquilinus limosus]|uniref:FecR domain-containing protein n=1 Tax=Inquilinus limosus TaxID=171674 RepID=UPI000422C017|nr:FecR domain-containing protein [Inquilinus limosus]